MAKVISTLFISADGVAEIDPDWHFPYFDENMGRAVSEDYDTADVLLIGRETYDSFAGAWPDREAAGGDDASFAKYITNPMQQMPGTRMALAGVRNEKDIEEIPEAARNQLKFVWLENIDDALEAAFDPPPGATESKRRAVA